VFAVRDCELSFISHEEFEERTIRHPEIYQHLINVLATRLRQTDEAVAAAISMSAKTTARGTSSSVTRSARATLRQWSGRRAKT
jgi:CRP-like cAMP-binding protein